MVGKKGPCVSESNNYISVRAESFAQGFQAACISNSIHGAHICVVCSEPVLQRSQVIHVICLSSIKFGVLLV